jgi:phage-related protein
MSRGFFRQEGSFMATSEARKRANKKYRDAHYKNIETRVSLNLYEKAREYIKANDLSMNALLNQAINKFLEKI